MPPFVLSVLKYALLSLLYFFVFRAVRSVATDLSGRRREARDARPAGTPTRGVRAGRPPSQVVVHEPEAEKPRSIRLKGSAEVGRADRCAIRVDDTYVSQVHARLSGGDGAWFVEDLGSTNGTFLNDRKVEGKTEIHAGDVVKVGKTVLELRR